MLYVPVKGGKATMLLPTEDLYDPPEFGVLAEISQALPTATTVCTVICSERMGNIDSPIPHRPNHLRAIEYWAFPQLHEHPSGPAMPILVKIFPDRKSTRLNSSHWE